VRERVAQRRRDLTGYVVVLALAEAVDDDDFRLSVRTGVGEQGAGVVEGLPVKLHDGTPAWLRG
jgi:hypothetical protein